MSSRALQHAGVYTRRYGMKLVPVPRGQKGPVREGWNKPGGYIEDPQEAQKYWLAHPEDGMGCVLGASGLCSLDLDNVDLARQVLCAFGVDIDALAAVHPTVVGNPARLRILFAVPQGVTLTAHKLSWPRKEEPGNLMHLFEMRAGPVQDVLPPSIHPGTGQEYVWKTRPNGAFPELPESLLTLWQDWSNFESQARAMCPWALAPTLPARQGDSVIEAYNNKVSVEELLERHGYKRKGKKYLAPESETGLAGVVIFDNGRCFSHHGNDPLADQHAHDAFDVFRILEHAGDFKAAARGAAQEFGLTRKDASTPKPKGLNTQIGSIAGSAREEADVSIALLRGSEMRIEAVQWLWKDYLAQGKLHIIAGAPGAGKTTLSMAMAATVTSGGRWPDGSRCAPGNVLIWSGEDDPRDTLLPRLIRQGADASKVFFVGDVTADGQARPFDPARDIPTLLREAEKIGEVSMLIIDPIVNAVAADSNRNAEVRRALQPIVDLASKLGAAAVGISHFTKNTAGRDPVERVTGSIAFGAVARVVFAAAKTVEEGGTIKRLFVRAKSNLSVDGGGYEYALEAGPVPGHPEVTVPAVTWGSALQGTARELLATAEAAEPVEDRSATDEAVDWLSEVLSAGRVKAGEVQKEARQAGITDKALRRARERLGVKPAKHEFLGGWWWSLPSQDAQDAQDAHDCDTKKRGIFEGEGHLRAGNDAGAVIV